MIAKAKLIISASVLLFIVLLSIYCSWLQNQLKQTRSENQRVSVALLQAQTDIANIRDQYLQIQQVVNYVEDQKIQLSQRAAELQQALIESQRKSPCAAEPVPDEVTYRLRQRAAEINSVAQ